MINNTWYPFLYIYEMRKIEDDVKLNSLQTIQVASRNYSPFFQREQIVSSYLGKIIDRPGWYAWPRSNRDLSYHNFSFDALLHSIWNHLFENPFRHLLLSSNIYVSTSRLEGDLFNRHRISTSEEHSGNCLFQRQRFHSREKISQSTKIEFSAFT